jgi:hypothetical protein
MSLKRSLKPGGVELLISGVLSDPEAVMRRGRSEIGKVINLTGRFLTDEDPGMNPEGRRCSAEEPQQRSAQPNENLKTKKKRNETDLIQQQKTIKHTKSRDKNAARKVKDYV